MQIAPPHTHTGLQRCACWTINNILAGPCWVSEITQSLAAKSLFIARFYFIFFLCFLIRSMSQISVESFSLIAHRQYFLGGFWRLALATRVGNRNWCFMSFYKRPILTRRWGGWKEHGRACAERFQRGQCAGLQRSDGSPGAVL